MLEEGYNTNVTRKQNKIETLSLQNETFGYPKIKTQEIFWKTPKIKLQKLSKSKPNKHTGTTQASFDNN